MTVAPLETIPIPLEQNIQSAIYAESFPKWVGLITPGHPRTPNDTPGHPKIPQDTFNFRYNSFIYSFIYSFRQKQSKNGI